MSAQTKNEHSIKRSRTAVGEKRAHHSFTPEIRPGHFKGGAAGTVTFDFIGREQAWIETILMPLPDMGTPLRSITIS